MSYKHINIAEIKDQAPDFGIDSQSARFVREDVGATDIGMAHFLVKPDQAVPFGHRHKSMEEMYVVMNGAGRFRVDDETFDVTSGQVVYVSPESWRGWKAGADGLELLAFGTHVEGDDESEMNEEFPIE